MTQPLLAFGVLPCQSRKKRKKNFAMVLLRFSSKEFLFLGARDNPGCSLDLLLLHRKS
jgi:hypothetical protein